MDDSAHAGGLNPARRRGACVPNVALEIRCTGRTRHRAESAARHLRVLTMTTRIAAAVSVLFGIQQFLIARNTQWIGYLNLASAVVFLLIPRLYRFGDVVPPVARGHTPARAGRHDVDEERPGS